MSEPARRVHPVCERDGHLWTDFDFPHEDGSVTKWCPRCGEKREVSAPARVQSEEGV